jgi:hypothetical protein
MKRLVCVFVLSLATSVTAQQPSVRVRLSTPTDPTGPARGWALASDVDATVDLPPSVIGQGPGVRLQPVADLTIVKPAWDVTGPFAVSALFERTGATSAGYGLIVGSRDALNPGLAFLVRPDGSYSIGPAAAATATRSWTPMALRPPAADGGAVERLEVRVGAAGAEFLVNGTRVAAIRIDPGALDGRPGVHVSGGADVLVAGFAVDGAALAIGAERAR